MAYNHQGAHAYKLANKVGVGRWDSIQVSIFPPMTGQPTFYNLTANGLGFITFNASPVIQNNLTVNADTGLDLGSNSLSVEGTLTNNGLLKQTKDTSTPAVLVEFLRIKNAAATADKYHGVDITPNSNMGSTTVQIAGNQTGCSANPLDSILTRCFTITPGTAPVGNATVRFWFTEPERNSQTANAIKLWHQDSPGVWSQVGNKLHLL